jgi:hypothetical protein
MSFVLPVDSSDALRSLTKLFPVHGLRDCSSHTLLKGFIIIAIMEKKGQLQLMFTVPSLYFCCGRGSVYISLIGISFILKSFCFYIAAQSVDVYRIQGIPQCEVVVYFL